MGQRVKNIYIIHAVLAQMHGRGASGSLKSTGILRLPGVHVHWSSFLACRLKLHLSTSIAE